MNKLKNKNKKIKTAEIFSPLCFWSSDRSKINLDNSKSYIITKVISDGNMNDIITLFNYYGWNNIKEEIVKIRYLNKKILNWLSSLFEIDPKYFKCYNNRGIF
jgi:hypothetical protein